MSSSPVKGKNDFYEMVFDVVRLIPRGRVTSYGLIASYLGSKSSSRMVGWAMNQSHKFSNTDKAIPAHRVVNRQGLLTGKMHFSTPFEMEEKLKKEGVLVVDDQIQNFESIVWDPAEELLI